MRTAERAVQLLPVAEAREIVAIRDGARALHASSWS